MTNPFALIIEDDVKLATTFAEALPIAEFEYNISKHSGIRFSLFFLNYKIHA